MIKYFGYPAEEHHVITKDGYILSLQRIPRGRKGVPPNGGVVFLQHGLVSSSADYVMNLPENSLGFILADLGYDVWLGNSRGNTYSNKHVNMSINDPKFWSFRFVSVLDSFHSLFILYLPSTLACIAPEIKSLNIGCLLHELLCRH